MHCHYRYIAAQVPVDICIYMDSKTFKQDSRHIIKALKVNVQLPEQSSISSTFEVQLVKVTILYIVTNLYVINTNTVNEGKTNVDWHPYMISSSQYQTGL